MEMKGLKVEMKYLSIPECPEKTFKRSKREDFWKGRKKTKNKTKPLWRKTCKQKTQRVIKC